MVLKTQLDGYVPAKFLTIPDIDVDDDCDLEIFCDSNKS
jgi:hypothetical protein